MPEREEKGLLYAEYLMLNQVLSAQHPRSGEPDELQFIVVHQVHELWFKLTLSFLERARAALEEDQIAGATRLIGQVTSILDTLILTVEHLHSPPPWRVHRVRARRAPGSGRQSGQGREIELVCGLREAHYVEWVQRQLTRTGDWGRIAYRLEEPSLNECFQQAVTRQGLPDLVTLYANPAAHGSLYLLAEALSTLEHRVLQWRARHIQLVERTIGVQVVGTGGTTNDYLQATLQHRLFPGLWEARNELSRRVESRQ